MKINAINSFNYATKNKINNNQKPQHKNVSFGFSEDYGYDYDDRDFRDAKDPNTLRTLWLLVQLPAVLLWEGLNMSSRIESLKPSHNDKKIEDDSETTTEGTTEGNVGFNNNTSKISQPFEDDCYYDFEDDDDDDW